MTRKRVFCDMGCVLPRLHYPLGFSDTSGHIQGEGNWCLFTKKLLWDVADVVVEL